MTAIIIITNEVTFNNYVQPICLWDSKSVEISALTGKLGTVVGWGLTETDNISEILRQAVMPVASFTDCLRSNRDVFGSYLSDNNFCAGFRNGTSVCNGDSGGSIAFEENGIYRIRGIVSLTVSREDNRQLCNPREYVLFTDAAKYLTWIKDVVPQLKHSAKISGEQIFHLSGNIQSGNNCEYIGGSFNRVGSRKEQCGELCSSHGACTLFTWQLENGRGVCVLKNFGGSPTTSTKNENDTVCGWIVRYSNVETLDFLASGNMRRSLNCGFSGNDIMSRKSTSAADCVTICEETKNYCTHFNWTSADNGTCWLKQSLQIPIPNYTVDEDALCGFVVWEWEIQDYYNFEVIRWKSFCEYSGDNIGTDRANQEVCAKWCSSRTGCYHFSWDPHGEIGYCQLKGKEVIISHNMFGSVCGWVEKE